MNRRLRGMLGGAVAALAVLLTACAGLPTSGDVKTGLALEDADLPPDINQIAASPLPGASPEEIVEGFLDAALTPADSWAIAREFLGADLAGSWRPGAGVTIDSGAGAREYVSDVTGDVDQAEAGEVRVLLDQIAQVDQTGAYTELSGAAAVASFTLARNDDGEWRITQAADGIVLDADAFTQVYRRYSLQYYDQSWTHLVPDVRWFPRRTQISTTLTQALIAGDPSAWLAPAVRSAFPSDVELARDSVPVDTEKVATVELTSSALSLDAGELARMRTQLEATLSPAGVSEVRLLVNGRDLDAGTASVTADRADSGAVVLTESEFGTLIGNEITTYDGISAQIVELGAAVRAVDVAVDNARAAVQLDSGAVFTVGDGAVSELDSRPGLVAPSMDIYGYTWTVPSASPQQLIAWEPDVTPVPVAGAFAEASAISDIRVGPDGVRIAAVVTVGGQRWLAVAAIVRDADGAPTGIGPAHLMAQIDDIALDLSWVGEDELVALLDSDGTGLVRAQDVGGPGDLSAAPADATGLAGGASSSAVRLLSSDGVLYAQRGTTWQMGFTGILVLGTHAGQ